MTFLAITNFHSEVCSIFFPLVYILINEKQNFDAKKMEKTNTVL